LYEWLDPIHENNSAALLLEPYRSERVDVLGLSCYVWNLDLQCQIAQLAKEMNPNCLVVAGGPQPDYKDVSLFRQHPYIDAVVVNDGEISFTRILEAVADRKRLDGIRGLYLPDPDTGVPVSAGDPEVPTSFDYSPYVDQSAYFEQLMRNKESEFVSAVWETNRGCPYRCSFCDWGSNTMSKVRRFDMARVEAEIEWFGWIKLHFAVLADANFGMLPRDTDIADLLCGAHAKHGYPHSVVYSAAKNNPLRPVEIALKLARAGISNEYLLSIQHTRPEVLAATERSNISADKQIQIARTLQDHGLHIETQVILGIPGDTYELWKSCLGDLMERGIHEGYCIFPYHLLPNAPAAERTFRERWQIQIKTLPILTIGAGRKKGLKGVVAQSDIIVQSASYSEGDWVRMSTYQAFVKALHGCNITRLPAVYLRRSHGIPFKTFYEGLIDGFLAHDDELCFIYHTIARHFEEVLAGGRIHDELELDELPGFEYYLRTHSWIFVQLCFRFQAFWNRLSAYLLTQYAARPALADAIEYQKNLVILPSYHSAAGKSFPIAFDWPGYFNKALRLGGQGVLDEPVPLASAEAVISDRRGAWQSKEGDERWMAWIERTVLYYRNTGTRTTFANVSIRQRRSAPPSLDAGSAESPWTACGNTTVSGW
jgi:putative methyltransferase